MIMNRKHSLHGIAVGYALLIAPACVMADYSSEILGHNPVTYYRFSEDIAAPAYDYAANNGALGLAARGRYTGTVTKGAPGVIPGNSALTFSNPTLGTGYFGSVNVPNNPALNPTPDSGTGFTVEFWAKPTNNTAALLSPLGSMSFTTGRSGYMFYQNGATWQLRIGDTASTTPTILNGGTVTANDWQHVAATYTGGSAGTAKLYVNGAEVGTITVTNYEANTNAPFSIGSTAGANRTFDGSVDEVAFYPAVLSGTAIAAHYTTRSSNPAGYSALVQGDGASGYWRLNEVAVANPYPTAANLGSLGTAADASYIGGVTTTGTGPRPPQYQGFAADNKAISLPTSDGYVGTPLSLLSDRNAFTVVGWIKRGAVHSVRGGYFGQNDLLEFGDADTGTNIEAWIDVTGGNIKSPYPSADDEWVFIALTGTGQVNELFLNGELAGSRNSAEPQGYGSNAFKFNIGGGGIFNTGGDYFLGEIDEVAVFDKALSTGQVKSLYHAALGNVAPEIVAEPAVLSPVPPAIIYATTTFSLVADASGTPPLNFQWRKNGTPISGATSRIYTKTGATTGDNGDYDVVVTNGSGSVTSTSAVNVTVNPAVPPVITTPPAPRTTLAGGTFSFSVTASGTGPFTYQWLRNGEIIPGAAGATYSVAASAAAQGSYTVRVTNVVSTVTSDPVTATYSVPAPGSYDELVMSLSPLAYWKLDEAGGATAADSAAGNDGTFIGGVTPGVTEAPKAASGFPGFPGGNRSAEFDGSSGYVRGPGGFLNNRTSFTLAGWVRRTALAGRSSGFFGQNDKVEFGNSSDTVIGAWTGNTASGTNPLVNDEWGFVVLTHEASPGVKTVYVNGVPIGSAAYAVQPNNSQAFCIGGCTWNSEAALNDLFTGQIDEVAVFPAALTSGQVCQLYLRGLGVMSNEASIRAISGGTPSALSSATFDAAEEGFTVETPAPSSETEWVFTAGSWRSNGQENAAGSDNVSYLISPEYTATAGGLVSLSFSHRYSFEADNWDGGNVEVSVNGGAWARVSAASFSANGYNGQLRGDTAARLGNRQGFVLDSAGHPAFITSACALTGVNAGDKVRVRFAASYDNNTGGNLTPKGWEIDSLSLTQGGSGAAVSWSCGILQQSLTLQAPWTDITGDDPVVIDTTAAPKKFFRIKP